jgi:hypothetical protein
MIDLVLSDQMLGKNSKRIAVLLLANIYLINTKQVQLYTKKQSTIQKLENFFIYQKDLYSDEVDELY